MDIDVEVDVVDAEESGPGAGPSGSGSGMPIGEGAGVGMGMERDDESDEIVRVLEKGLPRWEGFENIGWMGNVGHVSSNFTHGVECSADFCAGSACGYRAYHQELQGRYVSVMSLIF